MHELRPTTHHGIPAYSLGREGVTTGTLTFGVGRRDEPPTLAGITHLIEHVILRLVQPVPILHRGSVDTDSVEFFATGTDAAVANFLNAVSAAIAGLSSVSDEAVSFEKRVIEAENALAFHHVSPGLLSYRFGLRGLGVAGLGAPTVHGLSRSELVEWARRWLTAENATLSFTGAVPAALDLVLPSGSPETREPAQSPATSPRIIRSAKDGVALSLLVSTSQVDVLGAALTAELFTRLRHARGLIYGVEHFITRVDNDFCQLDLIVDPTDKDLIITLTTSIDTLRELAALGFSADAIEYTRNVVAAAVSQDRVNGTVHLDSVVVDALRGRATPTPASLIDAAESATATGLKSVLNSCLPSLIVAVPRDSRLSKKAIQELALPIDDYSIWRQHTGKKAKRQHKNMRASRPSWHNRSSNDRLWLTKTHLLRRKAGRLTSIRLADVAVVGNRSCGCICLIDREGRSLELVVRAWKQKRRLRRQLLNAFPAELVRAFPGDA